MLNSFNDFLNIEEVEPDEWDKAMIKDIENVYISYAKIIFVYCK